MYDITDKYLRLTQAIANGTPPPGYRIKAYVRSTGQRTSDTSTITSAFYTSLTTALAACSSNVGDCIVILDGHTEAVGTTMFTSAPTGVTIVGSGNVDQDQCGSFTWGTAASNWAIAAKNTTIAGVRLIASADGITEMVTVTAAGVRFVNCYMDGGVASNQDATIMIHPSTGANQFSMIGNEIRATAATGVAQVVKGDTVVDEMKIVGNKMVAFGSSTTVGLIDLSAALTNVFIAGNILDQMKTAGTVALSVANVASTGTICDNYFANLNNGVANATGIIFAGTNSLIKSFQNYNCDEPNKSGVLSPAAVAT